jgi:hypothetical protein
LGGIALAQEAPRLRFEAATIKPSDPAHIGAQAFSPGPGRFTAMTASVKDLAGLEPSKGPVEVLVIDHAEKASEN